MKFEAVRGPGTDYRQPGVGVQFLRDCYFFSPASAFSTAEVSSGDSGSTFESKRAITFPSGPTRNLVKFHPISPPVSGCSLLSVRNWYRGVMSLPLTETFAIIEKLT